VQVALRTDGPNDDIQSVAICAGSGGSMLLGVDADAYFTGEMSHVRPPSAVRLLKVELIHGQHEVLAAVATGRNVILCKSSERTLHKEYSGDPFRRTHEYGTRLLAGPRNQVAGRTRDT
jgi:NIF3 (NGG1p interacting factor 3)